MSKMLSTTNESISLTLPVVVLQELLRSGALKAKDIQCLDEAGKKLVQRFCLESCLYKECCHCQFNSVCDPTQIQSESESIADIASKIASIDPPRKFAKGIR